MRLIDADSLLEKFQFRLPIDNMNAEIIAGCVNIARRYIENEPTVDAVEVVRCKDCKHYDNSEGIQWCHINSKFYPGGFDWHSFPEDGYWSSGERKFDG